MKELVRGINPRTRVLVAVVLAVSALSAVCLLYFARFGNAMALRPVRISVGEHNAAAVDDMSVSGVFSETFYADRINKRLARGEALLYEAYGAFLGFQNEFRSIYPTGESVTAQSFERFKAGYVAIVVALASWDEPTSFFASHKYVADDAAVIVMTQGAIDRRPEYNRPLEDCQQIIGVIYLKAELLATLKDIHITQVNDAID